MTGARVLAIGGFAAGVMGAIGGAAVSSYPNLGGGLLSIANITMLVCNLYVMTRKDRQ